MKAVEWKLLWHFSRGPGPFSPSLSPVSLSWRQWAFDWEPTLSPGWSRFETLPVIVSTSGPLFQIRAPLRFQGDLFFFFLRALIQPTTRLAALVVFLPLKPQFSKSVASPLRFFEQKAHYPSPKKELSCSVVKQVWRSCISSWRVRSQWPITGLRCPAVRKLFNLSKVIVSPNLIEQKLLLLFLNNTLLTAHVMLWDMSDPQYFGKQIWASNLKSPLSSLSWSFSEDSTAVHGKGSISSVYWAVNKPTYNATLHHMGLAKL